ncbi:MAG: response regulator [Bacteriovoracaceae bacterium]|jgi:CheY-like chemotaxis protein|nr:response regulator [Bacteriovoracaceae bacterium]
MKKITFVDDSQTVQKKLELVLTRAGFDFKGFTNPEMALQYHTEEKPDLLILDYYMLGLDADKFMVQVSEKLLFGDFEIVLFTASDLSEEKKLMLQTLGITNFLSKNISDEKLVEFVNSLIGQTS